MINNTGVNGVKNAANLGTAEESEKDIYKSHTAAFM